MGRLPCFYVVAGIPAVRALRRDALVVDDRPPFLFARPLFKSLLHPLVLRGRRLEVGPIKIPKHIYFFMYRPHFFFTDPGRTPT